MPSRPEIFLLTDGGGVSPPAGDAIIDATGKRRVISAEVLEVLEFVAAAADKGLAVQVTPLRDELRQYVGKGEIPFRSTEPSKHWRTKNRSPRTAERSPEPPTQ